MNRYPEVCRQVRERLLHQFPEAIPREGDENDVEHTLWMIDQIQQVLDKQGKIDRWIGWVMAKAHSLGLINLSEARKWAKQDVHQASA